MQTQLHDVQHKIQHSPSWHKAYVVVGQKRLQLATGQPGLRQAGGCQELTRNNVEGHHRQQQLLVVQELLLSHVESLQGSHDGLVGRRKHCGTTTVSCAWAEKKEGAFEKKSRRSTNGWLTNRCENMQAKVK